MTRAKDISKILTDADLSGSLDVAGTVTADGGIDLSGNIDNAGGDMAINVTQGNLTLDASVNMIYDADGGFHVFRDGGTERLRINSDGNVLIGRTSELNNFGDGRTSLVLQGSGSQDYSTIQLGNNGTGSNNQILGLVAFYDGTNENARVQAQRGDGTDVGDLLFSTRASGGSLTERMRIYRDGKVGIGTSSPSADLHILGTTGLRINNSDDTTNLALLNFDNNESPALSLYSNDTATVKIHSEGNTYFNGGNVGIGTSSPSAKLDVTGAIEADDKITIAYEAGSSDWELESTSGDDFTISRNGSQKLLIDGSTSNVGIGTTSASQKLTISGGNVVVDDGQAFSWGDNSYRIEGKDDGANARIAFVTADSERMRIDSGGNLLVGTTSSGNAGGISLMPNASNGSGIIIFDRNYNTLTSTALNFENNNSAVGSVAYNNSSTFYNTSSDHRLKENVTADWDATTRLKQLNPVRFNFIADADTTVDGFLAHEVQSVVPEAISGTHNEVDDDGNPVYQGIDQSKLVPLLVKTIQELEARITALETA